MTLLPSNLAATVALALVDEEGIRHFIQDIIIPSTEALNDEIGSRILHLSVITFEAVVDFVPILLIADLLAVVMSSLDFAIELVWLFTYLAGIQSLNSLKHFLYLRHAYPRHPEKILSPVDEDRRWQKWR